MEPQFLCKIQRLTKLLNHTSVANDFRLAQGCIDSSGKQALVILIFLILGFVSFSHLGDLSKFSILCNGWEELESIGVNDDELI